MKRKHATAVRQQPKNLKVSKKGHRDIQKLTRESLTNCAKEPVIQDVNGNLLNADSVSVEELLLLVSGMESERLWMLLNVVENLLSVMDALYALGFYDDLCPDLEFVDEENNWISDREVEGHCSHGGDGCTIDVTEDDLLQLAAETQQDDGETEDLIEGLRTLKFGAQDEVVICLRSRFIEMNAKKEELNESDEDLLDEHDDSDVPISPKEDDLDLLPPEKYKTCPPSSFDAVLKSRSALPKGSDSELERPRSETTSVQKQPSSSTPKKSRSLPDIVDDKKTHTYISKTRKGFDKTSTVSLSSSKPKAPWIPSGKHIAPKVNPKPDKFFSSNLKSASDSLSKGLRQRVLTRATEISKKSADEEKALKQMRKPRAMSKNIEEKTKVFSSDSKYGVVYNRTTRSPRSPEKRPPWRYGKSKAPAVPLPTIKPFIMRKAARQHELGLNRTQLKNLQSDLSKVLEHSHHASCSVSPARFSTLASSPLGRISSSASRVAAATFASSSKPQTEYNGCEVCRLKEAMRNSPVSHRLKNTPHRCSSQQSITTINVAPANPKVVKPKSQSSPQLPNTVVDEEVEKPKATFNYSDPKQHVYHSVVVPITVFSFSLMLLLVSLMMVLSFSSVDCLLYHFSQAIVLRFFFHCFNTDPSNTIFLSHLWQKLIESYAIIIPLELYEEGKKLWFYLTKIYWKDALSFVFSSLPKTSTSFCDIFKLMFQDGRYLASSLNNNYTTLISYFRDQIQRLPLAQRIVSLLIWVALTLLLSYFYPGLTLTTFLLAPVGYAWLLRERPPE